MSELVKSLSCVQLFATPWTVAYKDPLSMEISRQEYCSGLPFPAPGDLPNPGIESKSPTLQADALQFEPPGKFHIYTLPYVKYQGFPGCAVVKNPPVNAGDTGTISAFRKIPWSRKWQPTSVFLPGKLHGQRSLEGYSPRGHKLSDLTEQLCTCICKTDS